MVKNKRIFFILLALLFVAGILLVLTQYKPSYTPFVQEEEALYTYTFPIVMKTDGLPSVGYHFAWYGLRDLVSMDYVTSYTRAYPFKQSTNPWPDKEFIPAVHCRQLDTWQENYPVDYTGKVFVLNEPVLYAQGCRMEPKEAADFIVEFRNICPKCNIIAPSISQHTDARVWFIEFMTYNPPLDGIAFHYYDWIPYRGGAAAQLNFYASYGYPLYITEWGVVNPSRAPVLLKLWGNEPLVMGTWYFSPYIPRTVNDWPWQSRLFNDRGLLTPIGKELFAVSSSYP